MINIITKYTDAAKEAHKIGLKKKIDNNIYQSKLPDYIKLFIKTNLEELLVGNPQRLIDIDEELYSKIIKGKNKKRFNTQLRGIFNYDNFINKKKEYNSYNLAENLKINCCPNCNRQYTITINSNKKEGQLTRPDFDHYFPKSKHPILALSFYNLIPSCKICNSTFKGKIEMDLSKHIHPYLDSFVKDFSFDYDLDTINKCKSITININSIPDKTRIKNTFDLFKIEETYNGHKFIVDQILELKKSLNDDYLKLLSTNTYTGINLSPEEAYRIGFGVNYSDNELFEHPFSKFKKDILTKEGMLSIFASH